MTGPTVSLVAQFSRKAPPMTTVLEPSSRHAVTDAPLAATLRTRWSPRAFDPTIGLSDDTVHTLLEAARWSPSASNTQPWRFAVAHRGTAGFEAIHASLLGFNQVWADSASLLIVAVAETVDPDGNPRTWAQYDLGQSIAHLSFQARHDGLHTHQMAGFDHDKIRAALHLADVLAPVTIVAVGVPGDVSALPEKLQEREVAPRTRRPIEDVLRSQSSPRIGNRAGKKP